MVGSCEELGSWTLSHKACLGVISAHFKCCGSLDVDQVHMGWSEGNIWRAKVIGILGLGLRRLQCLDKQRVFKG